MWLLNGMCIGLCYLSSFFGIKYRVSVVCSKRCCVSDSNYSLLQDRDILDKNDPQAFIHLFVEKKTPHYDIPICFTASRTNYNHMIFA